MVNSLNYDAKRVAPWQYKVSSRLAAYLTEQAMCTIMPSITDANTGSELSDLSLVFAPRNVWHFNVAPQIESLSDTPEHRRFLRLTLGCESPVCCRDCVIDISSASALLSFIQGEGLSLNERMVLTLSQSGYILKTPLKKLSALE